MDGKEEGEEEGEEVRASEDVGNNVCLFRGVPFDPAILQ